MTYLARQAIGSGRSSGALVPLVREILMGGALAQLLAIRLFAQIPSDLNIPNTTLTSGETTYQATNSVSAVSGFSASGAAAVTFVSGHVITIGPGFHATAGSAAITFQAT